MLHDNPNPSIEETTDVVAHALVATRKANDNPVGYEEIVDEVKFTRGCINLYMGQNTPSRRNLPGFSTSAYTRLYNAILTRAEEIREEDAKHA